MEKVHPYSQTDESMCHQYLYQVFEVEVMALVFESESGELRLGKFQLQVDRSVSRIFRWILKSEPFFRVFLTGRNFDVPEVRQTAQVMLGLQLDLMGRPCDV